MLRREGVLLLALLLILTSGCRSRQRTVTETAERQQRTTALLEDTLRLDWWGTPPPVGLPQLPTVSPTPSGGMTAVRHRSEYSETSEQEETEEVLKEREKDEEKSPTHRHLVKTFLIGLLAGILTTLTIRIRKR